MAQSYSARSRAIEPFHVMALLARANELQAAGHDVIHLEIGEPDFTTAEPIIAAGQAALAAGKPCSFNKTANSTIKIAFLAANPTRATNAIWK